MAREAAGSRRKRYRSVCCWRRAASACRRSCQALSFTGARSSPLQARRRAAPQLTPSSRTGHDRTDFSGRHNTCKNDRRRRDNTRWTGEHETIRPLSNPPFGIGSGQRAKHISHAQTPQRQKCHLPKDCSSWFQRVLPFSSIVSAGNHLSFDPGKTTKSTAAFSDSFLAHFGLVECLPTVS